MMFQFPLYWFSVPALLKGWMDRVVCQGLPSASPGSYDDGFLKDKLAILSLTTGGTASILQDWGQRRLLVLPVAPLARHTALLRI